MTTFKRLLHEDPYRAGYRLITDPNYTTAFGQMKLTGTVTATVASPSSSTTRLSERFEYRENTGTDPVPKPVEFVSAF
ncbi:MAG: hypothetical protein ACLVJ6_13745 [Merdibacter sp.]